MSENRAVRAQILPARRDAARSSNISYSRTGRFSRLVENSVMFGNTMNDYSGSPIVRMDWQNCNSHGSSLPCRNVTESYTGDVGNQQSNRIHSQI